MLLTLPQETLSEIVAHLRDEERALQSLSLVDKRLTEECRRYLFWSINIDSEMKLQRWHDAIPPGKDGLSRYVHLLGIDLSLGRWRSLWPNLQDDLADLCSFTEVEYLSIRKLEFDWFSSQDLRRCFSHFSTIRSISIQPSGYLQDIPDFLALFPLLETTVIASPNFMPVCPSVDLHFTNLVCGGDLILKLARIDSDARRFPCVLSSLTWPTTRYRRLGMGLTTVMDFSPLELFLRACGSSLEVIQIIFCIFAHQLQFPDNLLSPLTGLRDIALSVRYLNDHHNTHAILSSIVSTRVDSVTLIVWTCQYPNDLEDFCSRWAQIENALCRLSELRERAGCGDKVILNVHFDNEEFAGEVLGFAKRGEFLPRFQEVGVVHVKTELMDMDRAMSRMMPAEFTSIT